MAAMKTLMVLATACVLSLAAGCLHAAPAGEQGLVGLWKFDEKTGTVAADSSGNNNDGTIHGGAIFEPGRVGNALKFDGQDDYVDIPRFAALDNLKQVTLMAWIKTPIANTEQQSIFERWLYGGSTNERSLEVAIDGRRKVLNFGLSGSGGGGPWLTSSKTVPANQWVHIAVTSDGLKTRIYINGQQDPVVGEAPASIHPSAGNLHIGAWYSEQAWNCYFDGLIDEVSIYSRALTAEEILEKYRDQSAKGGVEGLVRDVDRKPIAGALVEIGPFSATTDEQGRFELADVPEGVYKVVAIKKGYLRKAKNNVTVEEDDGTVVSFKLAPDTTAPVISGVKTTNTASLSAIVVWTTDEPAIGSVNFGTEPGKYTRTASDPAYTTGHSVALTGLAPKTTYYFVAASVDKADNTSQAQEQSFTTDRLGDVIVWDTNKKYTMKSPTRFAIADKDKWTQVPYGVTGEYTFKGDPIIQNEYCQLFLFTNKGDSVDLAGRKKGGGYFSNEIYKVNDRSRRSFGMGTVYTRILKNTPDEMAVEHAGRSSRGNVVTIYTLKANKPWLKVEPKSFVNQQGMHAKSRICAFLQKDGTEIVFDAKREPWTRERNIQAPDGTIGILDFHRSFTSGYDYMWFVTFPAGIEKSPLTYLGFHWDPFNGEEVSPDRPSVGAKYAALKEKVILSPLGQASCWNRENVAKPISAGQTYTSSFSAPYPGKWRLIGRVVKDGVDKKYYASDVNVTKADVAARKPFTFTSEIDGKLDYLIMYIQDRNEDTPKDFFTPMDVYREAILDQDSN